MSQDANKNPKPPSARPAGSGLDGKLAALRYCIAGSHDEDALAHLFDLIIALRVRAAVTGVSEAGLTPEGKAALSLLVPNVELRRADHLSNDKQKGDPASPAPIG